MDGIRQYIIQVTAAALVCGIVSSLTDKKSSSASVIRLMTVLFMTLTILSPLAKIRLSDVSGILDSIQQEGDYAVADGSSQAQSAMSVIIKQETEAYILDKADSLGAGITVHVTVSDDVIPQPVAVRISGAVSPYGRQKLKQIISEELGIPLEEQEWTD